MKLVRNKILFSISETFTGRGSKKSSRTIFPRALWGSSLSSESLLRKRAKLEKLFSYIFLGKHQCNKYTCQGHLWKPLLANLYFLTQIRWVQPEIEMTLVKVAAFLWSRSFTSSLSELATSTFFAFFFFFFAFFPVLLPVSLGINHQANLYFHHVDADNNCYVF